MKQPLNRRFRKLRVRLLKRIFPYKILVRNYYWQTWRYRRRPAPFLWLAIWRAYFIMHHNRSRMC